MEHRAHVGDGRHVPRPDRSVRTRGAIANWRYIDACADSIMKFRFVPGCKRGGDTYKTGIRGPRDKVLLVPTRAGTRRVLDIALSIWPSLTMVRRRQN